LGEDGVADSAFQGPERLFGGFPFGPFALVIGPAVAVALADLGDRGHVE